MLLRMGWRILIRVGREVAGFAVVLALVLGLATMPPIEVMPAMSLSGYVVRLNTAAWAKNLSGYWHMIVSGTLGRDHTGNYVAPMVAVRLGHSLILLGIVLALALLLGVPKGIWDFRQIRRRALAIGPLITGAVQGIPDFLLVFLLQYGVVLLVRWFGWRPFLVAWSSDQPIRSMVLPVICLTLIPWAYVARLTSTAMNQVWDEDYIRTAHAKGLSERVVVYRHAFRNALILVLEGLPNLFVVMVSNLLIVEYLFGFPGLTILLKDSVGQPLGFEVTRGGGGPDVSLLVGAGVALCLVFTCLYTVVRGLCRVADPRRKEREAA